MVQITNRKIVKNSNNKSTIKESVIIVPIRMQFGIHTPFKAIIIGVVQIIFLHMP